MRHDVGIMEARHEGMTHVNIMEIWNEASGSNEYLE
jgi:hypothetical protein